MRELLLFSGHEEENPPPTEGVAFMLSRVAQGALIGCEEHGLRIITASFETQKKKIQCYAPTNDSDEETKDRFYSRLQSILDKCREKDVIVLMGDFNAKIGTDNNRYEEVMGTHPGCMNITGTEQQLNRWAEHFEELLNRPALCTGPPP